MNPNENITANFTWGELIYGIQGDMSDEEYAHFKFINYNEVKSDREAQNNLIGIASRLQMLRDLIQKPIIVTSGFRCKRWEILKGRNGKSQHAAGKAVDSYCPDLSILGYYEIIDKVFPTGGRAVNTDLHFVHYDTRASRATWDY